MVVKTPAAVAGVSDATMQRSLRSGPVRLMPQAAAAERNPRAAFTPPAMRFRFLLEEELEELTGMKGIKGMAKIKVRKLKR